MNKNSIIQVDDTQLRAAIQNPAFGQVENTLHNRIEQLKDKLVTADIEKVPVLQAQIAEVKYTLSEFKKYKGGQN